MKTQWTALWQFSKLKWLLRCMSKCCWINHVMCIYNIYVSYYPLTDALTWADSGCGRSRHRCSSEPWSTRRSAAAAGRQTAGPDRHSWQHGAHRTVWIKPVEDWTTPPPSQHLWGRKVEVGKVRDGKCNAVEPQPGDYITEIRSEMLNESVYVYSKVSYHLQGICLGVRSIQLMY